MLETMHYDIHLTKERDLLASAEMHRAYRLLKPRRKKDDRFSPAPGALWPVFFAGLKHLRHVAYRSLAHERHA